VVCQRLLQFKLDALHGDQQLSQVVRVPHPRLTLAFVRPLCNLLARFGNVIRAERSLTLLGSLTIRVLGSERKRDRFRLRLRLWQRLRFRLPLLLLLLLLPLLPLPHVVTPFTEEPLHLA
jgi:hypothetical protein